MMPPEMEMPGGNRASQRQGEREQNHCASPTADEQRRRVTRQDKLKADLFARGFSLVELPDGSHTVTKWGLSRSCADLDAVADFLAQIGGAA